MVALRHGIIHFMTTATKEHLKQMIDDLPEETAVELERLLAGLLEGPDWQDWLKASAIQFGSWFSEDEYEYPLPPDPGQN